MGIFSHPARQAGTINFDRDATLNDQDKTVTFGGRGVYQLLWIEVEYISDVNAANRQIQVDLGDGTNVVFTALAAAVQIASQTETYRFLPGLGEAVETVAGEHYCPLPQSPVLPGGGTVRVYASSGGQAADDMTVTVAYIEYL